MEYANGSPFFYPAESDVSIAYHKSANMNEELTKIDDTYCANFHVSFDGYIVDRTSNLNPI